MAPKPAPLPTGVILTVASLKGGVGKTTDAANLAAMLTRMTSGRVLLVDWEVQGGVVAYLMARLDQATTSVGELIAAPDAGKTLSDAIVFNVQPRLDVAVGGGAHVTAAMMRLSTDPTTPGLPDILRPALAAYDYIVIDTTPTLDAAVLTAMSAADVILVPSESTTKGVRSADLTIQFVRTHQDRGQIPGALAGMYWSKRPTNRVHERRADEMAAALDLPVMTAAIPERAAINVEDDTGVPYVLLHPESYVTEAFLDLAEEALRVAGGSRG